MVHRSFVKSNRGFTLVELLVVMAVMAVLVAVLFPTLIQARNRARSVTCVSNLRHLGTAVQLYAQDWEQQLPELKRTPFAGQGHLGDWPDGTSATLARMALAEYLQAEKCFTCPGDRSAPAFGFQPEQGPVAKRTGSSYVPWATARAGRYGIAIDGASITSIDSPASQVLFMDYGADWHGQLERHGATVETVSLAHVVYLDGHTQARNSLTFSTEQGCYVWMVGQTSAESGFLRLDGSTEEASAELTGSYDAPPTQPPGQEVRLRMSGVVMVGDMPYQVDREFTFGENAQLHAALRSVTYWVESLAGQ